MYVPENYYSKQQLVEICQVVKAHNGLVTTHIRGEGNSLTASIREVIDIAKESGVSLHISHLKAAGKNNWNDKIYAAIQMIDEARAQGLDVTCDVYPYTAGSTTLTTLMPPWSLEGGITHTLERIKDSTMRQKLFMRCKMKRQLGTIWCIRPDGKTFLFPQWIHKKMQAMLGRMLPKLRWNKTRTQPNVHWIFYWKKTGMCRLSFFI